MIFFEKTYPEPLQLQEIRKKGGELSMGQDIKKQLRRDFHCKCYLCERVFDKSHDCLQIEHFAPKTLRAKENLIRKYNWSNLFLACPTCNQRKASLEPLLNPIVKDEDIEKKIFFIFHIDSKLKKKIEIRAITKDREVVNTASLLNKIYNGKNDKDLNEDYKLEEASSGLRDGLCDEMHTFRSLLCKYIDTESEEIKERFLVSIKNELSKSSQFTAFKRWFVKSNPQYKEFIQYIQDED